MPKTKDERCKYQKEVICDMCSAPEGKIIHECTKCMLDAQKAWTETGAGEGFNEAIDKAVAELKKLKSKP